MVEPLDLTEDYIKELKAKIDKYKEDMSKVNPLNIVKKAEILGSIHALQMLLITDEREKRKKAR